jgi:hypothetical protein
LPRLQKRQAERLPYKNLIPRPAGISAFPLFPSSHVSLLFSCIMFIPLLRTLAFVVLAAPILPARAETLVALMSDAKLRHFSSTTPNAWIKTVNITGVPVAQTPAALDFRPDGSLLLYTREGNAIRNYTVDPSTGVATVGSTTYTPPLANSVAFDAFAKDAHPYDLVLATDADLLLRFTFSPTSSASTASLPLFYDNSAADGDPVDVHNGANPSIVGLASTNAYKGALSAVLYGIDSTQNSLVAIDWETGSMDTIASLRTAGGADLDVQFRSGFDISGKTGIAYAALGSGTDNTSLFTIDLTTGIVNNAGPIGPAPVAGINVVDISVPPPTDVLNISTRGRVGTGEDVLIAGFIAQGGQTTRLIIRAIGPSLPPFGVNSALADPFLTIKDANGVELATNDNWRSSQPIEITQSGLAPANDLESAFVSIFPPGQYTAIVSGKDGGTGVGLVEIYQLPD